MNLIVFTRLSRWWRLSVPANIPLKRTRFLIACIASLAVLSCICAGFVVAWVAWNSTPLWADSGPIPTLDSPAALLANTGVPMDGPFVINGNAQGAHSVLTADFDRDGRLDIVSAARTDGKIIWYRNLGGDPVGFEPRPITTIPGSYLAYPTDLNQDGRVDIVVVAVTVVDPSVTAAAESATVAGAGVVLWLENNGAPSPGFVQHPLASGLNYPVSAVAADFDGDGDRDVAVASRDDKTVRWYESNGAPIPSFTERLLTNNADGAVSVDGGDVDGDGDYDLVSASENDDKLAWYRNDGGRIFTPIVIRQRSSPAEPGTDYAKSVRLVDVDHDGDLDLLYASENASEVGWYENNGAAAPQFTQRVIGTGRDHAKFVSAADLNSDGAMDVFGVSSNDDTVAFYKNNGARPPTFTPYVVTSTADGARFVSTADLDGDGDLDLLIASRDDGKITWVRNRTLHRSALFPSQVQRVVGIFASSRHVQSGDLDGDGDRDLASVGDNALVWYENNGAATPTFSARLIPSQVNGGRWLHLADLDRDGDLDIIMASTKNRRVYWYENLGGAPLNFGERVLATNLIGPRSVLSADLDRDGDLDVYAASDSDNKVAWYENNGARPPSFTPHVVTTDALYARSVYAADLDTDGDLDLVSASQHDDAVTWYENLRGKPPTFAPHIVAMHIDGVQHVHAADLDRDGDMDIISASELDKRVTWFENQGQATSFVPHVIDGNAPGAHAVYTGDADNDGDQDIFAAIEFSNSFVVYLNDGQRTPNFAKNVLYSQGQAAHSIFADDIDADGDLDLLGTSRDDGKVYWFENQGGQYRLTQTSFSPGQSVAGVPSALAVAQVVHLGRSSDVPLRVVNLDVEFTDAQGAPLSAAAIAAKVRTISVYRDACCNGLLEPAVDPLLVTVDVASTVQTGRVNASLLTSSQPLIVAYGQPSTLFAAATLNGACVGVSDWRMSLRATAQTAVDVMAVAPLLAEQEGRVGDASVTLLDPTASLRINEVMADNDNGLVDSEEPGEYPDWIELYNMGGLAVDLSGMYWSDDPTLLTKYRIPDGVTLAPRTLMLFIADGDANQGPLHLNFRLDKTGETLLLSDTDARGNKVIDSMNFGPQVTNISVGRQPDGTGAWRTLPAPTPRGVNVNAGLKHHLFIPLLVRNSGC